MHALVPCTSRYIFAIVFFSVCQHWIWQSIALWSFTGLMFLFHLLPIASLTHTQREIEGWREANRKYESTLPQNYFVCIKKLKAKSANKAALTKVRQPRMHRLCCRTCVVRFTFISILSGKSCILHRWKLPQAQLDSFVQTFRYQKQSEEIKSVNIGCKKKYQTKFPRMKDEILRNE